MFDFSDDCGAPDAHIDLEFVHVAELEVDTDGRRAALSLALHATADTEDDAYEVNLVPAVELGYLGDRTEFRIALRYDSPNNFMPFVPLLRRYWISRG